MSGTRWAAYADLLAERDALVSSTARERGIPMVFELEGGYQAVGLHLRTVHAAMGIELTPVPPKPDPGPASPESDRTYRCILRNASGTPARMIEWAGTPPEVLLVSGKLDDGEARGADATTLAAPGELRLARTLYRPRVLIVYYDADP
jgi:hypothetical protein